MKKFESFRGVQKTILNGFDLHTSLAGSLFSSRLVIILLGRTHRCVVFAITMHQFKKYH